MKKNELIAEAYKNMYESLEDWQVVTAITNEFANWNWDEPQYDDLLRTLKKMEFIIEKTFKDNGMKISSSVSSKIMKDIFPYMKKHNEKYEGKTTDRDLDSDYYEIFEKIIKKHMKI